MKTIVAHILRLIFRVLAKILFRVRVEGIENYHNAGSRVLIIANHVSFLDGILLGIFLPKIPLFVINTYMAQYWWVRLFIWPVRYVTIDPTNPLYVKSLIRTIESDVPVVIFPEGRITVTGALMKVYHGPALVADKTGANILPVYLDGPQYSRFSRLEGVIRQRWFPTIRISIQPPRKIHVDPAIKGALRREQVGQVLSDIMRDMVFQDGERRTVLLKTLLDARTIHGGGHIVIEDIKRQPLSYNKLLRAVSALAGGLKPRIAPQQQNVALMLPNTIAMVAAFLGLHWLGKTPTMINYTMGIKGILSAVRTAGLKQLITSRQFVEAAGLQEIVHDLSNEVYVLYLEDIRQDIGIFIKLKALVSSWMPSLALSLSKADKNPENAAVILFTSGSEGEPKGVVLSHCNLMANRRQLNAIINFTSDDVMLNAMPLFHSFGLMAGMVLPLTTGMHLFLYPSPLHYNVIPELAYDVRATILFGTNTFLEGYARKAHPYDFHEARLVIAGAEKLQKQTRQLWFEKFGLRILEGYGATETSPVVSINTPIYYKNGSVGRLLPGIEYHLEPVEGIEDGGRLLVKGPNIMKGYLMPDAPEILQPPVAEIGEGWYDTGDIVSVDELQFITIQGRAKRFAKIAGEMVSLTVVEQLAKSCWPAREHAVVSQPDSKKGEKLVLFTTEPAADRRTLTFGAKAQGIGELAVPKDIVHVETIPLLGTGKTDYSTLYKMVKS
ncbi:MAG: AMP-binding protein [Gammaproteobacteria bacterium]|nr:AMP-binding protein [Gammaproteobacteria bacterium]